MTNELVPEPMPGSNYPGWTLETPTRLWQLWGPRPEKTYPYALTNGLSKPITIKARDHWAASWSPQVDHSIDGDYWRAESLPDALARIPEPIRQAFRRVAEAHLAVTAS